VASSRAFVLQQENLVGACKAEEERVRAIRKRAESNIERYKAYLLAVMQRFDVKELKAENVGGFRRQGNGGLEPLDIPEWPKDSSGDFKPLKEPLVGCRVPTRSIITWVPDTKTIREALNKRVMCPECKGGDVRLDEHDTQAVDSAACPRCHGERTVPATVEGACLLPRGEHVRVI